MATVQTGRQGYIGFAFQVDLDTPNTTPAAFLPWTEFSLEGKSDPQPVTHAVASRISDVDSTTGQQRSEGDLAVNVDTINAGYPLKLWFGNELLETGTPDSHTFFITVSGNTPKFATIIRNFGDTQTKQYTVCANTFNVSVTDELATLTVGLMGRFPTDGASQTPTTLSGTVMNFARYQVQLGATLTAAAAANTTPVEEFTIEGNNNITMIHSSRGSDGVNSNDVRLFRLGNVEITGSYKIFFDSVTERDRYLQQNKTAMIVKFSQGSVEDLTFNQAKVRYDEQTIDTGLEDLIAINVTFRAELDKTQVPNLSNVVLRNDKSTVY